MPSVRFNELGLYSFIDLCDDDGVKRNFINVIVAVLSYLDLTVYLSISAIMQDCITFSVKTSGHSAISFSNTEMTSSYRL